MTTEQVTERTDEEKVQETILQVSAALKNLQLTYDGRILLSCLVYAAGVLGEMLIASGVRKQEEIILSFAYGLDIAITPIKHDKPVTILAAGEAPPKSELN